MSLYKGRDDLSLLPLVPSLVHQNTNSLLSSWASFLFDNMYA